MPGRIGQAMKGGVSSGRAQFVFSGSSPRVPQPSCDRGSNRPPVQAAL